MSAEINFSELWKGQSTPALSIHELIGKATALKRRIRNRLIGLSILLLGTAAFIVWIWLSIHPRMLTTSMGVVMVIAAIVLNVVHNTGSIKLLSQQDAGLPGASYLQQLITVNRRQEFMHRVIMSIYFILLSAGVFLYMLEYALLMPEMQAIIAYTLTAAWFAFNWFYLRPVSIRKQRTKLHELIAQFERINKQLSE